MNNPFDNVPSTADVPDTVDKRTITTLTALTERFEGVVSREEAVAKNQEELAGVMFETFLDDDGSMKDFGHSAEIQSMLRQTESKMDDSVERVETVVSEIPTTIEVRLCEEDCNRLDKNFQSSNNVYKRHLPLFCVIGFIVGICILVSVIATKSAKDKRLQYEYHLEQLDRWHKENAEAISFGQFYRENYPMKYREWQTGHWQQDIAYRDSLIRAHSLDRMKHLYKSQE